MSIRVFIVEDHPVYRDALVEYIDLSPDLELCGVADSGEEAVEKLTDAGAHVVVTDLSLPGMSGFGVVEWIKERSALPCLVLSGRGEAGAVERALNAGADGYIVKGHLSELAAAIRTVADGGRFVSASLDGSQGADGASAARSG